MPHDAVSVKLYKEQNCGDTDGSVVTWARGRGEGREGEENILYHDCGHSSTTVYSGHSSSDGTLEIGPFSCT